MGRDSYRLRTNQSISDVLKSITKEQSAVITDSGGNINSVIDDSFIEVSSILKMGVYEIPSGTIVTNIDTPLHLVQTKSNIKNGIIYGENLIPEILLEPDIYINGVKCAPVSPQVGFGCSLSLAFPDEYNPFVCVPSKKIDRYRIIGDSNKNIILNSPKNTRSQKQSIFLGLAIPITDFLIVLLDGILVDPLKYTYNGTSVSFDFEVPISATLQIFSTTFNEDIYPVNSFKSLSLGILVGAFITNELGSVQVTKVNNFYKFEYNGSNLFASNLKIGDSHFTYLYDSTYLLNSGEVISSGTYNNCKQYSKVWGKLDSGFYALAGTLDYRIGKTFLVEGILL